MPKPLKASAASISVKWEILAVDAVHDKARGPTIELSAKVAQESLKRIGKEAQAAGRCRRAIDEMIRRGIREDPKWIKGGSEGDPGRARTKLAGMKMASLVLGTESIPPWLLRSRPDQVSRALMRGDPPRAHCMGFRPPTQPGGQVFFALFTRARLMETDGALDPGRLKFVLWFFATTRHRRHLHFFAP